MIKFLSCICIFVTLVSCKKSVVISENPAIPEPPAAEGISGFVKYTIGTGQHFADINSYKTTSYTELKFKVKFDSSAIYTNADPVNQLDINKLFGFADNNAFHQQFSARFGWRWSDNALRLFAYTYNVGVRDTKELGTVIIGTENSCSIKVTPSSYIYTLNGLTDSLPRLSTTPKAEGYKLYPYFGGDETAPHPVYIYIKEI